MMGEVVNIRPHRRHIKVKSFAEAEKAIDDFLDEDPAELHWQDFVDYSRQAGRKDGYGPD